MQNITKPSRILPKATSCILKYWGSRWKLNQSCQLIHLITYLHALSMDLSASFRLVWNVIRDLRIRTGCFLLKPSRVHYIYIIIIIMSHHQHGYPWPSLATPPYRPSLPAGPQDYIPYLHRAAVCNFELVALLLLGYVKGSKRVHHLWARPYFSSCVPHVWFV